MIAIILIGNRMNEYDGRKRFISPEFNEMINDITLII